MQHAEAIVGAKARSLSRHDLVQHRFAWLGRKVRTEPRLPHNLLHPPDRDRVASRNIKNSGASAEEGTHIWR